MVVGSRQVKRSGTKKEVTIKGSSRYTELLLQTTTSVVSDPLEWKNHLGLVAFTIVGILIIYWIMHPTSRV